MSRSLYGSLSPNLYLLVKTWGLLTDEAIQTMYLLPMTKIIKYMIHPQNAWYDALWRGTMGLCLPTG